MASGYQSEQQRLNTLLSNKLIVRVIEARGLKAADILSGTSDPYAEVRIAHQSEVFKTQWIKKTTCPFWNEEFVLHPKNPLSDILLVKIYDHDTVSNNDLLGQVEVPVSHLLNSNYAFEKWYPLIRLSGHHKAVAPGEVKLSVQYVNLSTTAFSSPTTTIVQPMVQPMVQPSVTIPPSYAPQQTFSPIPTNQYASPVMPVQQPMVQPMVQQPMVQQPMVQQPMVQQPMVQPMMPKPVIQQPFVQQPMVQQPMMQQPYVQQPMMQQPMVQQPYVQQPMMQQPYVQPMVQPQFVQQPVYVQPKPIVQPTVYVQPQPQVVVSPMMGMGMGMGMGYPHHHHHYGHHHKMKFKGYKKMYKGFKKFF